MTTFVRRRWPLCVFPLSASAMLLSVLLGVTVMPFHPVLAFEFFDLRIYRESAAVVLAGRPLYDAHFQLGFGFTYPPLTALAMLPLALIPYRIDAAIVAVANIALVVVIARCTLRLAGGAERSEAPSVVGTRAPAAEAAPVRPTAAWLLAAVALWTEPIVSAIGYGQIDLLIAALVLADLTGRSDSGRRGLGVGLAAALKLTPLIFIPYLMLSGRRRAATRALSVFVVAIVVAFELLPGDALTYWGGDFLDTSRVTGGGARPGRNPNNQSLRATLLRLDPGLMQRPAIWIPVFGLVAAAGLLLAVRAARRGDERWGFVLTAITGLLICPVSWTHHWTIAVPGVLLVLSAPRRRLAGRVLTAVVAVLALSTSTIWYAISRYPAVHGLGPLAPLLENLYVIAGLGTFAVAAVIEARALIPARDRRASGKSRTTLRVMPGGEPATADRQLAA